MTWTWRESGPPRWRIQASRGRDRAAGRGGHPALCLSAPQLGGWVVTTPPQPLVGGWQGGGCYKPPTPPRIQHWYLHCRLLSACREGTLGGMLGLPQCSGSFLEPSPRVSEFITGICTASFCPPAVKVLWEACWGRPSVLGESAQVGAQVGAHDSWRAAPKPQVGPTPAIRSVFSTPRSTHKRTVWPHFQPQMSL